MGSVNGNLVMHTSSVFSWCSTNYRRLVRTAALNTGGISIIVDRLMASFVLPLPFGWLLARQTVL